MMCIVCMTLFTTWVFLTNSSVGSQLMIFALGTPQSLQQMPDGLWFLLKCTKCTGHRASDTGNLLQWLYITYIFWSCPLCLRLVILSARDVGHDLFVFSNIDEYCLNEEKRWREIFLNLHSFSQRILNTDDRLSTCETLADKLMGDLTSCLKGRELV